MGRAWAKNILSTSHRVELVGWVDVIDGKARQAISELDIDGAKDIRDFVSLTEALTVTKPDFVIDVSIPEAHEEVTVTALRYGAAVLGENPMPVSLTSADRIRAACFVAPTLYIVSESTGYVRGLFGF